MTEDVSSLGKTGGGGQSREGARPDAVPAAADFSTDRITGEVTRAGELIVTQRHRAAASQVTLSTVLDADGISLLRRLCDDADKRRSLRKPDANKDDDPHGLKT